MSRSHAQYDPLVDSEPSLARLTSARLSRVPQIFDYDALSTFKDTEKPSPKAAHVYTSVAPFDIGLEGDQYGENRQFRRPFWSSGIPGWRCGARLAAFAAGISLLINLTAGIWALSNFGTSSIIVEAFHGDCQKVERMGIWIHFAINALSTALLSGSNYCMQCLSAPNRSELDTAHEKMIWLDIGVPSVRNLRRVGRKKVVLWWLLGLSSIPLHLMYNSAFFSSIATNDYNVIFAKEDFVSGSSFINNKTIPGIWEPEGWDPAVVQKNISNYERLENAQCIQAYATDFITDRRNVVIVVDGDYSNITGSIIRRDFDSFQIPGGLYNPYYWICQDSPAFLAQPVINNSPLFCFQVLPQMVSAASEWEPDGIKAKYCLSERVLGTCGFNINLAIILVVICCNIGKVVVMLYVSFGSLSDPLITVGDAISSYLDRPDPSTTGMCIVTRYDIRVESHKEKWVDIPGPKMWQLEKKRWFSAASKKRWWTCLLLIVVALLAIAFLLLLAMSSLQSGKSIKTLWSLGVGQVHSQTLISGWSISNLTSADAAITASVLIANLPQALLSFLYLTLNGLLTSMFLASEWSDFAHERKPLRVSNPRGQQRNTYFLQLPYRIAIPLLILSGLLHWLVSQSIFLAVVAQYGQEGVLKNAVAVATCGFSPFAMICVMIVGGCIVLFALALGFRLFKPGMPLVGSCSAAIAATCHTREPGAAFRPVQWGAVPGLKSEDVVGHCCFSSSEVETPIVGQTYAGRQSKKYAKGVP